MKEKNLTSVGEALEEMKDLVWFWSSFELGIVILIILKLFVFR